MGIKIDVDGSYNCDLNSPMVSLGHKTTKVSIRSVDIIYISQDYHMRILETLSSAGKVWSNRRQIYTRCFSGTYLENGRPTNHRTHEHGIMSGSMEWKGPRQSYPHPWMVPLTVRDESIGGKGMGVVQNLRFPRDARLSSS